MKSHKPPIFFRGYTKRENGRWVAICVDLNIAAQGSTFEEATQKCGELISSYLSYVKSKYAKSLHNYIPRLAPDEYLEEFNSILNRSLASRKSLQGGQLQRFDVDPLSLTASPAPCY